MIYKDVYCLPPLPQRIEWLSIGKNNKAICNRTNCLCGRDERNNETNTIMIMKRLIPLIFLLLAGYMTVRAQIGGQVEVNVNGLSFSKQDNYDVIRWDGGG